MVGDRTGCCGECSATLLLARLPHHVGSPIMQAKKAAGAVKEGVGKLTGDGKMQAEGKADKAAGKAQNTVGGAKDAVRDATD